MQSPQKSKDIFKSICDLVVKPEFQEDQQAFFDKYSDQFDPNEENKLEYTPIYEKYVEIVEKIIEAKLKDEYGHTNGEIEQFYQDFKAEMSEFEKEDRDTMDLLYGLVDFMKFKKSMLTYVKGATNLKATEEETNE
jgi:ADP-ribosylation factor 2-binding protein